MSLTITVKIPNIYWFSQNSRGHWAVKKRCTDAAYNRAYVIGRAEKNVRGLPTPVFRKCHVTAYIAYPPNARRYDPGNAATMTKPMIDALTEAGYWADDDSEHLIGPDFRKADHKAEKGWHEIILELEEVTR